MPITDRDKKTLIIGGSVVGFMLLAFLIYKLFLSGGGGTAAVSVSPPVVIPPGATGTPSASLSPTPSPTPAVVVFGGLDPFCTPQSYVSREVYLHIQLPADAYYCPGVVTPSPTASPTSSPSGSGSPSSTGSPSPSSTIGSAPIRSSATLGRRTVVLTALPGTSTGGAARVAVDGTMYNVAVGSLFAQGSFELQGVSAPCASFLYGDQAFTLCTAP